MLQSLKKMYGDHLNASDGELGQIEDFYFDDRDWAVRYVVADTGPWLTGQQVLISPLAFGDFDASRKLLSVNLTRSKIENSPPIKAHKPVLRQYEEVYHKYYGWPFYWESSPEENRAETNLLSTQAVTGFHVYASNEIIGHVSDFLMDTQSWMVRHLVIKIGHRFSGKEVQISVRDLKKISREQSTVFVNLTKEAIGQSPTARPA